MLGYLHGKVEKIIRQDSGITEIIVRNKQRVSKAINYDFLTGPVAVGDRVVINTTAVELALGTGGYDYVISNLKRKKQTISGSGHIMKLRYTPFQFKVLSVEEENSPYHQTLNEKDSLARTPVIISTLHSMLAPIAFAFNKVSPKKLIYIMTDGAALPLAFSKSVRELINGKLIHGTITAGNAFGGDLEAVNIYSALLAAKWVLKADCIVVGMGPGIVGTGTKWGFSGIEQGQIINAVASLGGVPIAVPRVSFADPRPRHQGLSHHTITVLKHVALVSAIVPFGLLEKNKLAILMNQWQENRLNSHKLVIKDVDRVMEDLSKSGLSLQTMGRGLQEEKEFFACCLAAGMVGSKLVNEACAADNP